MKIAFVTPFDCFVGGAEVVNEEIISMFKELGHQVDYITLNSNESKKANRFLRKIIGTSYLTYLASKDRLKMYDLVICDSNYIFGIKHRNLIVIYHCPSSGYLIYLYKYLSLKTNIILLKNHFFEFIFSKKAKVIAVSNFVKEILNRTGIHVDEVIENGIDTDHFKVFGNITDRKNYCFAGRYEYYPKGFDILED